MLYWKWSYGGCKKLTTDVPEYWSNVRYEKCKGQSGLRR